MQNRFSRSQTSVLEWVPAIASWTYIKLLADNVFIAKKDKIRDDLASTQKNTLDNTFIENHYLTDQLTTSEPVDAHYVVKLINNTPPKSCPLDPMPTQLLKRHVQEVAPYITVVINISTSIGEVSTNLKESF